VANDRISQLPVEGIVSPTSGKARTSQEPVETVVSPTSGKARPSQTPVEVIVSPTSGKARISQAVVEVIIFNDPNQSVTPDLINQSGVLFGPSINQQINVGLIDQSGVTFAPQVNQSVALGLIDQSGIVFAFTIPSNTVEPPLISSSVSIFSPTFSQNQSVQPGLIDQTGVLFNPTINQSVQLGLINQSGVTFAPTITGAGQQVSPALINQSGVLFEPQVNQSVRPGLIASTVSLFAPTFLREPSPPLIKSTVHLFFPDISQPGANQPGGPVATSIQLFYNGVDIWPDVVVSQARFTTLVNGQAGSCHVRIKDPLLNKSFVIGKRLRLRINGRWHWSGYVQKQSYVYGFDYNTTRPLTRFIELDGTDVNILFSKRIVFRQAQPAKLGGPSYPAFTDDTTVIEDLFADWIDLSGDAIDTETLVDFVETINEDESAAFAWSTWTWGQAMQSIAHLPAALYYIDPDQRLVYADVDTPSVPWVLTDDPVATTSGIGYREQTFVNDGGELINDALVWGISGGSPTPVVKRLQSADSISEHGRWQYAEVNGSVYKQTTVNRIASSIINGSPQSKRGHKDDRRKVDLTTFDTRLRASDRVRFVSNVYGLDEVFPIRALTVDFVGIGKPRFRMTLSHEIDAPWSFFDVIHFFFPSPQFGFNIPDFNFPDLTWTAPGCSDAVCITTVDFENFNRTVASGWGTPTYGAPAWFDTGTATTSVDGTHGVAVMTASTDLFMTYQDLTNISLPWANAFTMSTVWQYDTALTGVNYIQLNLNVLGNTTDTPTRLGLYLTADVGDQSTLFVGGAAGNTSFALSSIPSANTPVNIKWDFTPGGPNRAKVWWGANPEPDWMVTRTDIGVVGETRRFTVSNDQSLANTQKFDYFSFDANRCDAVQFDTFSRSVSNGWGTSDSGSVWVRSPSVDGLHSVNGSGNITYTATNSTAWVTASDGPWSDDTFTMRTSFKVSAVTAAWCTLIYSFISAGSADGGQLTFIPSSTSPTIDGFSANMFLSGPGFSSAGYKVKTDWVANTRYEVRLERTLTSARARIWPSGTAEPSTWDIEATGNGWASLAGASTHLVTWTNGWDNTNLTTTPRTVSVDYIEFDYNGKPCYIGGPTSTPTFVDPCEVLSTNGSQTTFTTTRSYQHGTLKVFLNGLFLYPGVNWYEMSPVDGTFRMVTAPGVSDVLRVCYDPSTDTGGSTQGGP